MKTTTKKKNRDTEVSLTEQIANVLGVAARMRGRYVVQKQDGRRAWKQALSVNPYMSDGGLQPPGPPLYGTPTYLTAADAADFIKRRLEADTYIGGVQWRVEQHSKCDKAWLSEKWGIAWNFTERYGKQEPFTVFDTKAEAEAEVLARNAENLQPPVLRVVSADEDVMLSTLYPKTEAEKALYGEFPKIGELLAKFPLLAHGGEPSKEDVAHWVSALVDDEVVDVALDQKGDGISEDCFITTAGDLKAACYGELSFERSNIGVTVYAKTREQFCAIHNATQ